MISSPSREPWLRFSVLEKKKSTSVRSPKREVRISIPKKAEPLAVRRNRLRRQLREAIRIKGALPPPGSFFDVRVRRVPEGLEWADVVRAVADGIGGV